MFGEDQCPKHHCKMEEYSGVTDCGEEWDIRCPKCYQEQMARDIAMAEEYARNPAAFEAKYYQSKTN